MSRIKLGWNVASKARASRKLGEKGRDQVVQALLVGIPKVKIKISHRSFSGLAQGFNVLDDCGTDKTLVTYDR
jgi:hypothetical protein